MPTRCIFKEGMHNLADVPLTCFVACGLHVDSAALGGQLVEVITWKAKACPLHEECSVGAMKKIKWACSYDSEDCSLSNMVCVADKPLRQ
jgi:hypothetical protein